MGRWEGSRKGRINRSVLSNPGSHRHQGISDQVIGLQYRIGDTSTFYHQPRFSLIPSIITKSTDPKLDNPFLSAFRTAKNEKMSGAFSRNENSVVIANSFNFAVADVESKILESEMLESKILAWLSPLEPWVRHRDIGAQRIDSIGA